MTGKIFRSTLAASLTVLLASLLVITGCLYTYFGTVREQQLQTELTLAAAAVEADGADYLARVRDTAERLTWVASDGAVLYDTRTDTQDVYKRQPYIISLIVLAFTSKNSRAPKAEGIPYDKGQR